MSGFRRFELLELTSSKPKPLNFPTFLEQEDLAFSLDLLQPHVFPPHCSALAPFQVFDSVTDLIQINKVQERTRTDFYLKTLSDRVSALELGLDRVVSSKKIKELDRKYSWTAEIKAPEKDGIDRKYKWSAEIKAGKNKGVEQEKNYKWVAEYKGKGKDAPISRTYTFKASTAPPKESDASTTKKKKDVKKVTAPAPAPAPAATRVIEIKEPADHGVKVLKQAFAKRAGANGKGKKKELSPQDAAMMIQMNFRAYLIRRSQALRALRELAIAKSKLKEIRVLFNNFSYRRRIARDAEERQRFSERIIVLLLTVDAIEGADLMVRAARRSMVNELEAMLDAVDPQPAGKLGSMKRRTFDMPDGGIQREIAAGVAEVVQMLDQDEKSGANTFEVCL